MKNKFSIFLTIVFFLSPIVCLKVHSRSNSTCGSKLHQGGGHKYFQKKSTDKTSKGALKRCRKWRKAVRNKKGKFVGKYSDCCSGKASFLIRKNSIDRCKPVHHPYASTEYKVYVRFYCK